MIIKIMSFVACLASINMAFAANIGDLELIDYEAEMEHNELYFVNKLIVLVICKW